MATALLFVEKTLFPRCTRGQRRRHMRFLMLGLFLGAIMAVGFGAVLYQLNSQGRL